MNWAKGEKELEYYPEAEHYTVDILDEAFHYIVDWLRKQLLKEPHPEHLFEVEWYNMKTHPICTFFRAVSHGLLGRIRFPEKLTGRVLTMPSRWPSV
jgi:hypothetical protein